MRTAIVAIVLAGLVGLLGWQIQRKLSQSGGKGGPRRRRGGAVAVELAPVKTTTVRDVRVFTGSLSPASQFVVAPKVGGRLEELTVQLGNPVKRGQLIARIDDAEYRQQVLQARAELEVTAAGLKQCRTKLALAKVELDRVKALRAKKIASESEVDTAESEHRISLANEQVALAQEAQKKAALKAAEVRLAYTRIHASWEREPEVRYVGERFIDEGTMLTPNTPILSVVEIADLRALIHVTERDYPRMKVGQPATVTTDAFPGEEFPAKILLISKVLREASRQARVELEVPNAKLRLKPGMFIRTRVEFARHEGAAVVPRTALVRHKDRRGVFLIDKEKKKASFVATRTGIVDGDLVEVLEPKISGFVATLGNHLLSDGATVVLPKPKRKRGAPDEKEGAAGPGKESGGQGGERRRP
jgi:RND family efflux transporter MFP subunit